jgi:hypothetical protein
MNIDDIIRHIDEDCYHSYEDDADYAWVELQYIPKIVALLKAGQAMRSDVRYYYNDSTSGTRAWDAATKEGV